MDFNERMAVFLDTFDTGKPPYLEKMEQEAKAAYVPSIRPQMQRLLKVLLTMQHPMQILEVGCAVGFSACLMSEYMPAEAHITTIEKVPARIRDAETHFQENQKKQQITLLQGDASDILKQLEGPYDCIFMDAAKAQYIHFLPEVLRLLAKDGVLVSDNILQEGDILESRYAV